MASQKNTDTATRTTTIPSAPETRIVSSVSDGHRYHEELRSIFSTDQQVAPPRPSRSLTQTEESIITTIHTCLKNWHKPWKDTFLDDGREFRIAYELMEGLLHYEYQITNGESTLSSERTAAIAQAVARLVDYGNAILGIDLVIRANDDAFSETDPLRMTTIELFQAHMKAHKLREKLLYDYFKKDKPNNTTTNVFVYDQEQNSAHNPGAQSPNCLQLPRGSSQSLHPLVVEGRSPKSPRGSTTSINSLVDSGRRTPSQSLPSPREMDPMDLRQSVEVTEMMATIKSRTFSASHSSTTRLTQMPGILAKIESLLNSPSNSIKIAQCFDLLDALLDSIESLPDEAREKEVSMISMALLRHLVRKVYVDDRDDLVPFQRAHWTTCLLSLVRLMGPNFNSHLKQFNNLADLGAFLNDYLFVVKRLLSSSSNRSSNSYGAGFDPKDEIHQGPTYPDCWIEMTLLACSTFLSSLTSLYQILRQVFPSNLNMWLAFINCLVHFPSHQSLAQDRLLMKERQKLLADDIRRTSAEYVWISWESLTLSQKQQLLEDLMEPLLRASIALHSKHRSVLLPIFYDMMRCDYTVQYITPRGSFNSLSPTQNHRDGISLPPISSNQSNDVRTLSGYQHPNAATSSGANPFLPATSNELYLPYLSPPQETTTTSEDGTVLRKFTHLIVGKLNNLILDLKLGDESFTKELCAAISGELNPKYNNRNSSTGPHGDTSQFKSMAKQTSDLIAEFLQICMDCRHANRLVYKHLYLLCLFKLILFFRDKVDRAELYLTNLYKLSHLHHVAQRYAEAGYTLLEHAKSLPWSDGPLLNHYRVVTKFFNISQQQLADNSALKIFLYNTIMEYFDQAQNWEAAVPLCKELINYYENKTYEYGKLAQQLDKMSGYFKNISNIRNNPEYFRVTFYGGGFPRCLKDMTVIYRGRAYEKLSDFQSTIISKYPDSKPLSSLSKPDRSILEDPEARFLQINACSPVVDLQSKFPAANIKTIREPLLNYYRHNCCDKFQFSRRVNRSIVQGNKQQTSGDGDNFANMWRERTTLTTNTFPGMLPFFPVYLIETSIVSPIESAIEDLERINDRLATMVNLFRADERHTEDVRPLGQLLLGVVDAAVNGGISKYEQAFFNAGPNHRQEPSAAVGATKLMVPTCDQKDNNTQTSPPPAMANHVVEPNQFKPGETNNCGAALSANRPASAANQAQVDKLKYLIAKQVPLLDEAIQLHRDRVAEVMRPQHEHLEASYKKLKHHITANYHRYLPHDYGKGSTMASSSNSTLRSYRSMTRSPRSTLRASAESRLPLMLTPGSSSLSPSSSMRAGRLAAKRMSDVGPRGSGQLGLEATAAGDENQTTALSSSIPYRQLANERKSLPFLTSGEPSPSSCTRIRRESSRNGHFSDGNPQYEEIEDDAVRAASPVGQSPEAHMDESQNRFITPPKPFARSSIKIRLPFGGVDESDMKKELLPSTTSVNDESQYMHLINCDRNSTFEEDDDDDDDDD